ncbi:MAG TPA: alpha/beta fold hydrolase [Chiayiivirga sp.]|nr:alpha/beta fold hydrolase [Chiayiivirga sp.]
MKGHCILSHGLNSSPHATKVSALAQVAEVMGYTHERPDYRDIDTRAGADIRDVARRLERLLERARAMQGPLVLVGSSMGAYISARATLEVPVVGLYLMAPPVALPGYPLPLDAAVVPLRVVHGWGDELISAQSVVDWCQARKAPLQLVDDGHRLEHHVPAIADDFRRFLEALA